MDLLATVRKEGSRGGSGDFKWSDVQNSTHREQYLGHSLHAPVGRYNQGKDLSWYTRDRAKDSNKSQEDPAAAAARERAEEIKRIKEAEEDALARALGLPVAPRTNANAQPLGDRREVDKIVKESAEEHGGTSGVGFSHSLLRKQDGSQEIERIEGNNTDQQDKELNYALKEYRRRHGHDRHREQRHNDALLRERDTAIDDDRQALAERETDIDHRQALSERETDIDHRQALSETATDTARGIERAADISGAGLQGGVSMIS
ncbi:hypothetical protein DV735_g1681, partial [Chaetothyriales sp. CBS 134920]